MPEFTPDPRAARQAALRARVARGDAHERARIPALRRRQPLLRGRGRLHPPHRPPHARSAACSGRSCDGRKRILVGGKLNSFIPNPTFDPVVEARRPRRVLPRRESERQERCAELFGELEPIRPEYRDRDARLRNARRAGPRRGAAVPDPRLSASRSPCATTSRRPTPCSAPSTAGSTRPGASPTRSACSPSRCSRSPIPASAVAELEWVLGRGARLVYLRPAPVPKPSGSRLPRRLRLTIPFWARVSEAGVTVAFHTGDSGYGRYVEALGEARARSRASAATPSAWPRMPGRAVMRHLRRADRARRLRAPPEPAGGEHRERLVLGAVAAQELEEGLRPDGAGPSRSRLSRPSAATSGWRPTSRTTRASWPT